MRYVSSHSILSHESTFVMTTATSPKPTVEIKNGVAVDFQKTEETGDEGNQFFLGRTIVRPFAR
jgi:hypothetical protein